MRAPTPEEEERLRERWRRVGRAVVEGLAMICSVWTGHPMPRRTAVDGREDGR